MHSFLKTRLKIATRNFNSSIQQPQISTKIKEGFLNMQLLYLLQLKFIITPVAYRRILLIKCLRQ